MKYILTGARTAICGSHLDRSYASEQLLADKVSSGLGALTDQKGKCSRSLQLDLNLARQRVTGFRRDGGRRKARLVELTNRVFHIPSSKCPSLVFLVHI